MSRSKIGKGPLRGAERNGERTEETPREAGEVLSELLRAVDPENDPLSLRRAFESLKAAEGSSAPPPSPQPGGLRSLAERSFAAVRGALRELGLKPGAAEEAVRHLLGQDPAARWVLAERSAQLARPEAVTALLSCARDQAQPAGEDPEELARLGLTLIDRLDKRLVPRALLHDLQSEAWAIVARELLHQGGSGAAESALVHAEELLAMGSGDPLSAVRVGLVRVQVAWHRESPPQLRERLAKLRLLAAVAGDPWAEGEVWIWRSALFEELGDSYSTTALLKGIDLLGKGWELVWWQVERLRKKVEPS